jgi:hypothetical protein
MRCAIAIAVALCMLTSGAQATSVVAVRTPTTIVLGADSKLISGDGSDTRTFCKIGVSNNVLWGESIRFSLAKDDFFDPDRDGSMTKVR